MTLQITPEIQWLVYTLILTAFMWIPYILRLVLQLGPMAALGETSGDVAHEHLWAARAKRAHYNAVENLVIFAPLILLNCLLGINNQATAFAAMVYFFARVGHYVVYTLGIAYTRTPMFAIGMICQLVLMFNLLKVV